MPDLLALTLTLKPLPAAAGAPAPRWWGRAVHALWLDVVAQIDPALAQSIHDGSDLRPYTLSTLMGRFPDGRIAADETCRLRITALQPEMSDLLARAVTTGPLSPDGDPVTLDYHGFRVVKADWEEGPWTGQADYTSLAANSLAGGAQPPKRLTMRFASPTLFKSRGRYMPVPLPEHLFGSLLRRWNAFSPIAFPDEVQRYAEECLAIARYDLHTRVVEMKNQGKRPGVIGEMAYVSICYDRYWMSVIHTLAAFARFGGAGAGVTLGLGQCRLVA
jgi:CRISPR-associated endoribonuclease Cas6